MIGFDSNVLIRFLTKDDPQQFALAASFFQKRSAKSPAFLASVVLAETMWVLRSRYKFTVDELSSVLSKLLGSRVLVIEGREALETSQGVVSPQMVADFIVAHLCKQAGCKYVMTFDKRAAENVPEMELLT